MPRGWWGAVPGGGGLPLLSGVSGVRRCPSPGRPSSGAGSQGSATCVSRVRLLWAWGPSTGPTARALAGRHCAPWGWRKGVPGGGAVRRCVGRPGSGAPPPPTARPLGGLLGSATHVLWARCAGLGALHRPRGRRALWGAARHGGGGGRLGSGAPSSLLPALWAGCRGPLAASRGCGGGCVRCVWCLCGACRGAGCCPSPVPLVPPSLVLCCGVALPVCLPCPLPCARPLLVCWLSPVSFVASLFFTLSSALRSLALLPGMHVFPASALVRVSVFPLCLLPWAQFWGPLLSLLLGPVRQREDWGVWAY